MGGKPVVLEFDHIGPTRDWVASQLNELQRIKRYEQEFARGEIQLLCGQCNKHKGEPVDPDATYTAEDQWEPEENILPAAVTEITDDDVPF